MADSSYSMPSGFGGLVRYNEEYNSKIKFNLLYKLKWFAVWVTQIFNQRFMLTPMALTHPTSLIFFELYYKNKIRFVLSKAGVYGNKRE